MDIQTSPDPFAHARELGAEIVAAADEIERMRRIPEALLERLHTSRLFRMLLPRAAGGDETEPALYVAAIEELARHDASIAWNVFVANSSCPIAAYLEPATNHAAFADPRSIAAWGPPNASHARAVDAGYCLTGKWDFASGCRQARWMGAHGHVLEADGTLRLNRIGRPTVRTTKRSFGQTPISAECQFPDSCAATKFVLFAASWLPLTDTPSRIDRNCGFRRAWRRLVERKFLGGEVESIRAVSTRLTVIACRTVTCCHTTNTGSC